VLRTVTAWMLCACFALAADGRCAAEQVVVGDWTITYSGAANWVLDGDEVRSVSAEEGGAITATREFSLTLGEPLHYFMEVIGHVFDAGDEARTCAAVIGESLAPLTINELEGGSADVDYIGTYKRAQVGSLTAEGTGIVRLELEAVSVAQGMPMAWLFVSSIPQIAADLNSDRAVDFDDFLTLQTHYGMADGATHADGDIDLDGDVDFQDFMVLQMEMRGVQSVQPAVPEPHSSLLGLIGFVACALFGSVVRRRRQRHPA